MEHLQAFANNFLIVGVPQPCVEEIFALAECKAFTAGERIVGVGERSSDLYVVLEGNVNVQTQDGDKLFTVGKGDLIGEVSLVDDQPRSADVYAVGLVKVAKLPSDKLRRYMATHKDVGFIMLANLSRVLSARLRNATIAIDELQDKAEKDPWKFAL
jgi:CRP/FNR family cyclic AMP-dependent transcriptional regulator